MGQILVRQLDDATITRLKIVARERKTSVEALARQAISDAAKLTVEEKRAVVARMQAITTKARVPGVRQTPSVDLIREDRDR